MATAIVRAPDHVARSLPEARDAAIIATLTSGQNIVAHLPEADLLALLRRSRTRAYKERDVIYRRGEPGRNVLAVLDGYVKLSAVTGSGREVVLRIAGPGTCFGELGAFNEWPRGADAVALSPCRLLAIDGAEFRAVMRRSPRGLQMLIECATGQLRQKTERMLDTALPAPARLAKALLYLADVEAPPVVDGTRIPAWLSQAEVGGMVGLTRESINKQLAAFREAGWIALSAGAVTLRDVAALRRAACDDDDAERIGSTRCFRRGAVGVSRAAQTGASQLSG